MAMYFGEIDLNKLQIGPDEHGQNGGRYRKISYNNGQLKDIQLGENVHDLLRCPFGVEAVSPDQQNKLCMKLNITPKLCDFMTALDNTVIQAVGDTTGGSTLVHRSTIRVHNMPTMKIKLLPETQVFVTTIKTDKQITTPVEGGYDDIKPGSMLLPIVKIKGGVYFVENNYGTSIVATQILVVKGGPDNGSAAFNLGDVMLVEMP